MHLLTSKLFLRRRLTTNLDSFKISNTIRFVVLFFIIFLICDFKLLQIKNVFIQDLRTINFHDEIIRQFSHGLLRLQQYLAEGNTVWISRNWLAFTVRSHTYWQFLCTVFIWAVAWLQ
jgi:hypothetical protein